MKKRIWQLGLCLIIAILTACSNGNGDKNNGNADSFPQKDIQGIIQWGEGGGTDIISRSLASYVEDEIDASLVMQNKTGATGAIATQYVYDQPADGHTLLFSAENPNLYQLLEISERDYMNDFVPISIIGQGYAGIVVHKDSEFDTLEDLVEYAKNNPDSLKLGTSGEGGLPHVAGAMMKNELDVTFNQIPYDGDGPLSVALLGKEVDFTILAVSAAQEYVDSGDFKMLAVIHNERLDAIEDVPAITEMYEEFDRYLPWGPFTGVFAHKDTPQEIVDKLSNAFKEAENNEEFIEQISNLGVDPMNIDGKEAIDFVQSLQQTSTWMLYDAGEVDISPEDLGIPKIEK